MKTKKCKFCGKEINPRAKRCIYCDKWLDGTSNAPKKVKGIGGWLLLPTASLLYYIFAQINALYYWLDNFIPNKIDFSQVIYLVVPALLSIVLMLFLSIYTLVLEFKKKKQFVAMIIIVYWLAVVILLSRTVASLDYATFVIETFIIILWTYYFLKSKRVKNTFIK